MAKKQNAAKFKWNLVLQLVHGVREVEVSPESSVRAAILFKSLIVAVEPASKTNSQPALPACKLINMKSSL
jgi:hypothetical protein